MIDTIRGAWKREPSRDVDMNRNHLGNSMYRWSPYLNGVIEQVWVYIETVSMVGESSTDMASRSVVHCYRYNT